MRRKVVCVLKKSAEFDIDYVDKLREGLGEQDIEFTTIHDTSASPGAGWWTKLNLFRPDIKGDFLYFDLDTVIVGKIDDLFTNKLTMLSDFNLPHYVASGVMFLPEADRAEVWDAWIKSPEAHIREHRGHGDGGFLSRFYKQRALRFQDVVPGQIVSYKKHCKDGVPSGARVVCFHGQPRPRDVQWRV